MCVSGIPKPNKTHAIDSVLAALGMQTIMNDWRAMKIKNSEKILDNSIGILRPSYSGSNWSKEICIRCLGGYC